MHPRVLASPASCLLAAALCTAPLACEAAGDPRPGEGVRPRASAIIGGTLSGAEDDGVVFLWTPGEDETLGGGTSDLTCTGTLIAPNVLLTAKHCVAFFRQGRFSCTNDGALLQDEPGAGLIGLDHEPGNIVVFTGQPPFPSEPSARGAAIFSLMTENICQHDFAVVVLDRELDVPPRPLRLRAGTSIGESLRVVGYGLNDVDPSASRYTRSDVVVRSLGENDHSAGDGLAPPNMFELGTSGCFGDSGGPAFSQDGGALVGVYSQLSGECASPLARNLFVLVATQSYESLILAALEQAGAELWLEGEPAPGSSPGSAGAGGAAGAPDEAGAAGVPVAGTPGANLPAGSAGLGTGGSVATSAGEAGETDVRPPEPNTCRCAVAGRRMQGSNLRSSALGVLVPLLLLVRRRFRHTGPARQSTPRASG